MEASIMKARAKTKDNPTMNIYKFETRCSQQTELSNSKPCQKRSETDRFLAIFAHPTRPKRSFRFSLPLIYRGIVIRSPRRSLFGAPVFASPEILAHFRQTFLRNMHLFAAVSHSRSEYYK